MPTPVTTKRRPPGRSGKKTRLHLRKGNKIGAGLREVAVLQLDAAINGLRRGKVSAEAIHDARTYIKKLRAIIQIASPALPRPLKEQLDDCLKKTASRMGPMRDSEVRVQTFDLLLKETKSPPDQFSSLRTGFADVAKQQRLNGAKQIPRVLESLRHVRNSVPEWPMEALAPKDLRRRIKRTYRRGRTTLGLSISTKDPDDFHLWRKQVKQLWYQLRLTALHWPDKARDLISATGEIGHLAGIERDYTLLASTLSAGPRSKASLLLQEAIEKLLPDLRKKALEAGRDFYSKKPKEFVEDIAL